MDKETRRQAFQVIEQVLLKTSISMISFLKLSLQHFRIFIQIP